MWNRVFAPILVLALVGAHFAWLRHHCPPTFQSADANGYYAQVPLVAQHGRTELAPETPLAYIGLHWLGKIEGKGEAQTERFFSRYPPGVAWLLAPFYLILGPDLTIYVTPLLGSLTLLFLFLLCRPHIGSLLGLVAITVYGFQPDANSHALNWGAHTQVGFFLLAGLYLIDSWSRKPTWGRALLGGICLGVMPSMRPAEVAAGAGVAAFLLYHMLRKGEIRQRHKKHLLVAIAGAAVPIGALMYHNFAAFDHPLRTGYYLTGEQQAGSGFGWEFFLDKWRPFTEMLMSNGAGAFFVLGLLGLIGMVMTQKSRGIGMMLIGVLVPVTVVYMAYYWGSGGSGLRFMIPTFPLYTLPALWFLQQTSLHNKKLGVAAVFGLIALQGVLWAPDTLDRAVRDKDKLTTMNDAVRFVDQHLPEDSVLIVDRRLGETLQYYPKWLLCDSAVVTGNRRSRLSRGRTRTQAATQGRPANASAGGDNDSNAADNSNTAGNSNAAGVDRTRDNRDDDPSLAPLRASPMQRGKGRVLRKELDAAKADKRRELVAKYLADLRNKHQGGVYWIYSTGSTSAASSRWSSRWSRDSSRGSNDSRSAMRRLKFGDGSRFKFVGSVTLSLTTEQRDREKFEQAYEQTYGERPTRDRGRGRRGFSSRSRRQLMGAMFGPRSGSIYRLYKLAGRGEEVRSHAADGDIEKGHAEAVEAAGTKAVVDDKDEKGK